MRRRKQAAFRPGTNANHKSQIKAYLLFCNYYNLKDINPTTETICLFVEFLAASVNSPRVIHNYISGVRFLHKLLGLHPDSLYSFDLDLMMRSVTLTLDYARTGDPSTAT